MMSKWRWCDVVRSHRRHYDVMCMLGIWPPLGPPNILNLGPPPPNVLNLPTPMFFSLQSKRWKNWSQERIYQILSLIISGKFSPVIRTGSWVGWLFWAERPFEAVFQSISGRLPERGRKKREMIDERKNVQTIQTRTYCKCRKPLPYSNPN